MKHRFFYTQPLIYMLMESFDKSPIVKMAFQSIKWIPNIWFWFRKDHHITTTYQISSSLNCPQYIFTAHEYIIYIFPIASNTIKITGVEIMGKTYTQKIVL